MEEQKGTNLGELKFSEQKWTDIKFSQSIIEDALFKHILGLMQFKNDRSWRGS